MTQPVDRCIRVCAMWLAVRAVLTLSGVRPSHVAAQTGVAETSFTM